MKKTVGLYAARACSGPAYIYNQKLIPQGNRGVHTEDGEYPTSGDMVIAKGLFELMGVHFPEGTAFELDITITEPRKKGWYPATMNDNSKKILYWDGEQFKSGTGSIGRLTCTWDEDECKWVADEPIPNPFGGIEQ